MKTLTTDEARRFYDRFGAKQDKQEFYEAPALECLIANGGFTTAKSVFELGCGTGHLARTLLQGYLPSTSAYCGIDISPTMVRLATQRLSAFSDRAVVSIEPGNSDLPLTSQSVDRFVATYVFDLLSDDEIHRLLAEAYRILQPNGLLCLAGITPGTTILSRLVMGMWRGLFNLRPSLMGGCRPIHITEYINTEQWQRKQHRIIASYGIASEVLVARRA